MAIIGPNQQANGRRNSPVQTLLKSPRQSLKRLCWSAKAIQQGAMLTDTSQCVIVAVATNSFIVIDFKRNKDNMAATVKAIEYDPNRTANTALLHYEDGVKSHIWHQRDLRLAIRFTR